MQATLKLLAERIEHGTLDRAGVIRWGSPVPAFGNPARSRVATLGLNPSNREFVDINGLELDGESRRFHTLRSLGLDRWSELSVNHCTKIHDSIVSYFSRNPYDLWFKKLDFLISGTNASFYHSDEHACHLDLIPYATTRKWTELTESQRSALFAIAGDTLGLMLRDSPIEYLILNGMTVVSQFQQISRTELRKEEMPPWSLPRRSGKQVKGFSFQGVTSNIAGVDLGREIQVLGFNHNIQSSFGVTGVVMRAIRNWISERLSRGCI